MQFILGGALSAGPVRPALYRLACSVVIELPSTCCVLTQLARSSLFRRRKHCPAFFASVPRAPTTSLAIRDRRKTCEEGEKKKRERERERDAIGVFFYYRDKFFRPTTWHPFIIPSRPAGQYSSSSVDVSPSLLSLGLVAEMDSVKGAPSSTGEPRPPLGRCAPAKSITRSSHTSALWHGLL